MNDPGGVTPGALASITGDTGHCPHPVKHRGREMRNSIMSIRSYIALSAAAVVTCSTNAALTQWRAEDGGNGHYYDVVVTPLQTWVAAKAQAEAQGGYLASIRSQAENDWIWNAFNIGGTAAYWTNSGPWPGYDGPVFGAYTNGGAWTWVSGETWDWSNWGWSMGSGERAAQFIAQRPVWDDIGIYGGTSAGGNVSYIVEWNSNPVPAPGAILAMTALGASVRRRRAD